VNLLSSRSHGGKALCLLLCAVQTSCVGLWTSDLASRSDYEASRSWFLEDRPDLALKSFPPKETDGFITTTETNWLRVLAGTPSTTELERMGRELDARTTLSIRKETRAFFYKETEDGYFPAEHEAIVLHLITAMAFLQRKQVSEARVEARKAAFYLDFEYERGLRFDDPALRTWLAAIWMLCDRWDEARVDLKKAVAMSPALGVIAPMLERRTAPRNTIIVLAGPGPDVRWAPKGKADASLGLRSVEFVSSFQPKNLSLRSNDRQPITLTDGLPTAPWFDRHQERNHVIHDVLQDSRYMVNAAGTAGASTATYAVSTTAALVVGTTAVVLGVGIAVGGILVIAKAGLTTGGEYLLAVPLGLGGLVAAGGVHAASDIYTAGEQASHRLLQKNLDGAESYRYVRYLPDRIFIVMNEEPTSAVHLATPRGRNRKPILEHTSKDLSHSIRVFHLPSDDDQLDRASALRVWVDPDGHRAWAMPSTGTGFEEARKLCARLAEADGHNWIVPNVVRLQAAVNAGVSSTTRNTSFGAVLETSPEVWITGAADPDARECRKNSVSSPAERTPSDCSGPLPVLCTRAL
jgi:hypothetical protein